NESSPHHGTAVRVDREIDRFVAVEPVAARGQGAAEKRGGDFAAGVGLVDVVHMADGRSKEKAFRGEGDEDFLRLQQQLIVAQLHAILLVGVDRPHAGWHVTVYLLFGSTDAQLLGALQRFLGSIALARGELGLHEPSLPVVAKRVDAELEVAAGGVGLRKMGPTVLKPGNVQPARVPDANRYSIIRGDLKMCTWVGLHRNMQIVGPACFGDAAEIDVGSHGLAHDVARRDLATRPESLVEGAGEALRAVITRVEAMDVLGPEEWKTRQSPRPLAREAENDRDRGWVRRQHGRLCVHQVPHLDLSRFGIFWGRLRIAVGDTTESRRRPANVGASILEQPVQLVGLSV